MSAAPYVLLVEDNPITRKLVRVGMHHAQIDFGEAADGVVALEMVKQRRPDLILMDLMLPDIDGFALAQRLREMSEMRTVPILAFSGLLSQLDEKRVAESGFTDFVTKPIEPLKLVRIVRAHLPAADVSDVAPTTAGANRRIILADDDDVQRKLSVFRLTRLGYEVVDVPDGQAALDAARSSRPDAIITDAMMPVLDGFGLCAAIRKDSALRDLPIVLCTSTYVDDADRDLARLAGANQYVIRTPDLREMIGALEEVLAESAAAAPAAIVQGPEFERERATRTMKQLERQAAAAASARQQCAMLSAELAVLNAISEAITQDQDIDQVLRDILAACCDAGGVSMGALYLAGGDAPPRTIVVGGHAARHRAAAENFAGDLRALSRDGDARARVVTRANGSPAERAWLEASGLESSLVVPLQHKGDSLGALVMMSEMADLGIDDRLVFAEAVGHQVSVALTLTQAFDDTATAAKVAREHALLLESVFTSISDPILVVDAGGRATMWNAAADGLIGPRATSEHLTFDQWSQNVHVLHQDQSTAFATDERPVMRALAGESIDRFRAFMTYPAKPDGAWVSISARPLLDEKGDVTGAVTVSRDVTAERQAQEQLMISDRMASIGMMAAGVGHEINNPLSAVIANLEMAMAEIKSLSPQLTSQLGDVPAELSEALDAAQRVRQIARDLKVFSGGQAEAVHPMNVEDVLDSSVRMGWSEIRQRARLVKRYGHVPAALGAESRLGQVLLNLIVNAAQAIPEGQHDRNEIRLITRIDDQDRIVIDIEDTGSGIPPHVMKQLFTPFVTTKPVGIGTGLGLSICHRLVTAMGGSIWAESTVGAGTVFHVALPRAQATPSTASSVRRQAADTQKARILVIDDEDMIGTILRRALKSHDVTVMSSAKDALAKLGDGTRYDAILCDLMMPAMTGMEFHAVLTKQYPDQARALMFLTGGAFNQDAAAFLASVPNEQLEKPFDIARLKEKISTHLRARAADRPSGEAA
jgi:PAS domain S-box-containing protein